MPEHAVATLALPAVATRDIAAVAAEVLGTPVRYQQIPLQAFEDQFPGSGLSEAMAQGMLDMMIVKDKPAVQARAD